MRLKQINVLARTPRIFTTSGIPCGHSVQLHDDDFVFLAVRAFPLFDMKELRDKHTVYLIKRKANKHGSYSE